MDVRWKKVWVVQGANADEIDERSAPGVVAPNRNLAPGAAGDALSFAACRRRIDVLGRLPQLGDPIRLDQRIERKRCPRFALTPAAMATVHKQRGGFHPVAHGAAVATTFGRE